MPGILGVIGTTPIAAPRLRHALSSLDLLGRSPVQTLEGDGYLLAAAGVPGAVFSGPFIEARDGVAGCFAGDLHSHDAVPWDAILDVSAAAGGAWHDSVDGHFAVGVLDSRGGVFRLYSDHFGCHPVFYARLGSGLVFSTQLAAFVRLGVGGDFSEEWLHRFLFFGYWPGSLTYLEGVHRLGPGTVLEFDVGTGQFDLRRYEERFARRDPPLRGDQAIEAALERFRSSVPRMFPAGRQVEMALSAGLDSRTLYAFIPDDVPVRAFTYGMAGCDDQLEAGVTARRLGLVHRQLYYDQQYEKTLPELVRETVWLSGGLAWINRCMLPAVYRFVAQGSTQPPILSSGIALDTLFRGHNNARGDVHGLLATGEIRFTDPAYAELLEPAAHDRFVAANRACADALSGEHGRLSDSEAYLSYTAYTLCPSYFTADLEIGGHYASLRVPGYDRGIVKLAYEIENSTIYLSKFLPHDLFDEYVLQASLMASHPRLAHVPLQGIPLDVFVRRDKVRYQAYRLAKHGLRRIRRRLSARGTRTPIEDWDSWYANVLAGDLKLILGPDCRVARYVKLQTVERYFEQGRWVWLARLATAEMILRLIESDWDRSAVEPGRSTESFAGIAG